VNTRILFVVVAFDNYSSVDLFVDSLITASNAVTIEVAVCDNSPVGEWTPSHSAVKIFIRCPENPGYLEGALRALDAYTDRHGSVPEWVVLANTDLTAVSGDIGEVLISHGDSDYPVVLAPRITEGCVDMNPHIVEKRPAWRNVLNRWGTRMLPLAYLYVALSHVRSASSRLWPAARHRLGFSSDVGTIMYSPYGAMVIFSRGFFVRTELPRSVPLLAEEFAIAESARRGGVAIIYEPRIHFEHSAHTTTGSAVSIARARRLREAFRFIALHAKEFKKPK
jgi:GT2 family glycosyltransferase